MDKFLSRTPKNLIWILDTPPLHGTVYTALTISNRIKWIRIIRTKLVHFLNSLETKNNISLESKLSETGLIHRSFIGKFNKLNKITIRDLLWNLPERYIDYSKIVSINDLSKPTLRDSLFTVVGKILSSNRVFMGKFPGTKITIKDDSGILEAVFFRQPYLAKMFKKNYNFSLSGKLNGFVGSKPQMINPEYQEISSETTFSNIGKLLPVYSSTERFAQRSIRSSIQKILQEYFQLIEDFLDNKILDRNNLMSLQKSIHDIHYPKSFPEAENARKRLAFNELLIYQIVAIQKKHLRNKNTGINIQDSLSKIKKFCDGLNFELTNEQKKVLNDLSAEMNSNYPVARLLQGEVGSGKTIVALAALIATAQSNHQGVILSPTEVLAEQHFINICRELKTEPYIFSSTKYVEISTSKNLDTPIVVALLTGSLSQKIKNEIRKLIQRGDIHIIVGTHTLLQDTLEFKNLGMVVVDEQHRFGVEQRNFLSKRSPIPHLLALSATPIPRTLALTIYGDLDLSTIKELPKGRKTITTKLVQEDSIKDVWNFIENEVSKGHQAFIVCPFIEPSEKIQAMSAINQYELLSTGELSKLKLGLLHGSMSINEKQEIMSKLRDKEIDVLISTPVIEVGVDIPNATAIVILSSERFGMAQLHQLRGRVGRGENESFCFLVPSNNFTENPNSEKRLNAIVDNSDGFKLSEEDLILRGPGDYLGTRQSGWDELKIATVHDRDLLQMARKEAISILDQDPNLSKQKNVRLKNNLDKISENKFSEFF